MPPRKSTARQPSATPVKKTTRGAAATNDNVSESRRSLRSTPQAPDHANGVYPNLPEVQTQQSYAYGSTKAPLLPEQLRAKEKMSLGQMASTIDQQRFEADQRFKEHAVEVETNLTGQARPQTTKVTRRRASASVSPPREVSSYDVNTDYHKTQRTAAWASSLDSEQLQNIDEEESEVVDEDDTRHGTDPSSFPSGIYDNSYNYERGLRRPQTFENSPNVVRTFFSDLGGITSEMASDLGRASRKALSTLSDITYSARIATVRALPYVGYTLLSLATVALGAMALSSLFCVLYRRTLCDSLSTSSIQTTLQNYCGSCLTTPYTFQEDMTPEQRADTSFISKAISDLRQQLRSLEKRIDNKFVTSSDTLADSIATLQSRQADLEAQLASILRSSSSAPVGSLDSKINYFAPGAGAVVNPLASSPTLQKPPNVLYRAAALLTGSVRYMSNPPITALLPWYDLGDCWCAAGSADVRLAVKLGYAIYPTDIVLEHYPVEGSPEPGTAPREVEVWGSFGHLRADEWADKGVWALSSDDGETIGNGWRRVGSAVFEAKIGRESVQTFKLDINQGALMLSTDQVVVRVKGNHGASKTCLYRVRLHGVPLTPHPIPMRLDG